MDLSENLNFGIVNNPRLPVPEILILKVMASLTVVESLSIKVIILNFPTAPLNPEGLGSGKFFIFIFLFGERKIFVSVSVKNELKNGSKNGSLLLLDLFF